MEHRLSCFAFGEYPGKKSKEKNLLGEALDFADDDDYVVDLSASDDSLIIITKNGKSRALGKNLNGSLGIGDENESFEYKNVQSDEIFKKSKTSKFFSFWKNDKNQLFVAGTNKKYLKPTKLLDHEIISFEIFEKSAIIQVTDQQIIFWEDFCNDQDSKSTVDLTAKIKEISCGNNFCIILLENNSLFKYMNNELSPIIIPRIALDGGNRFLSASCSKDYISVVDINGCVWILGTMGKYNGDEALIPIIEEAEKVRAFPTHCVIFDGLGLCFTVGANEKGQLGNGSLSDCFSPLPMEQTDAAFDAVGGTSFTILLPFDFSEKYSEYLDEDIIPGSLAKALQNTTNFIPQ